MPYQRGEELKPIFWAFDKEGTSFFGKYLGVELVEYPEKDDKTKKKIQNEYLFEMEGKKIRVRGTTILNRAMPSAEVGKVYEIFYAGKEKTKDGKNEMKMLKVYPVSGSPD